MSAKEVVTIDHLEALATRTNECIADVAGTAADAIQEATGLIPGGMTGATANAAGTAGTAPAPAAGKQGAYLRGDATWADPVIISSAEPSDKTIIWFKTEAPAQANANEE